jgi:hypothetical protein
MILEIKNDISNIVTEDNIVDLTTELISNIENFKDTYVGKTDPQNELENKIIMFNDFINQTKSMIKYSNEIMPEFILFIEKYIGNKNGLYNDINDRFWRLITTSNKLMKNLRDTSYDIIKQNYNLNLFEGGMAFMGAKDLFDDDIKNMIITKRYDEKPIPLKSFMFNYGKSIMDVYMLGRILKKFEKSNDNGYSPYAENIIIVAGNAHIEKYKIFFLNIGSVILHEESIGDLDYTLNNPSKRCIKFEPIII